MIQRAMVCLRKSSDFKLYWQGQGVDVVYLELSLLMRQIMCNVQERSSCATQSSANASLYAMFLQALDFLHIFVELVQHREVPNFDPLRSHEHAILLCALEIPLSTYCAVVFSSGFVQIDADPGSN